MTTIRTILNPTTSFLGPWDPKGTRGSQRVSNGADPMLQDAGTFRISGEILRLAPQTLNRLAKPSGIL